MARKRQAKLSEPAQLAWAFAKLNGYSELRFVQKGSYYTVAKLLSNPDYKRTEIFPCVVLPGKDWGFVWIVDTKKRMLWAARKPEV